MYPPALGLLVSCSPVPFLFLFSYFFSFEIHTIFILRLVFPVQRTLSLRMVLHPSIFFTPHFPIPHKNESAIYVLGPIVHDL